VIGVGSAIQNAFANREWSREERDSINDVLDAAQAFTEFRLPLGEALKVGELATGDGFRSTAAFGRVRAVLAASFSDPRRRALLDLLDIVIAAQDGVQTNHGWFRHSDLAGTNVVIRNRPKPQAA
jgi:hypothetical protein